MVRFTHLSVFVATAVLLLPSGDGLPLQTDYGKSNSGIELEQMAASINEILLAVESGARTSRIFYRRNFTVDEESRNFPRKLFSELLISSGLEKIEGTVPMVWKEILSLKGPFSGSQSSKCHEVFHPDHLLSKVILENLITSNSTMEKKVVDELKLLFCNEAVKRVSMHYMQTDDVVSGLIVLSLMTDNSQLALANVGF